MMPAEELLACQIDLQQRLKYDPKFRRYLDQVLEIKMPDQPRNDWAGHALSVVTNAYAYQVSGDMSLLVQHMASGLDSTDRFHRAIVPTPCGMVRFETPISLIDIRGRTLLATWMLWGPAMTGSGKTGIATYWFNDSYDHPDVVADEIKAMYANYLDSSLTEWIGRWGTIACQPMVEEMRIGPKLLHALPEQAAQLQSEDVEIHPATNLARVGLSLFMLLGQTVARTHEPHIRRTTARLARRMNIPGQVTVVELRRTASTEPHDGEGHVLWSHRWIVRQYWRWQPYGSRLADEHKHHYGEAEPVNGIMVRTCILVGCDHRLERILIASHVKGPEGKPLMITDKIYRLTR